MKTVAQIAKQIGVGKQAIYQFIQIFLLNYLIGMNEY
jgi:hypothetical protein